MFLESQTGSGLEQLAGSSIQLEAAEVHACDCRRFLHKSFYIPDLPGDSNISLACAIVHG